MKKRVSATKLYRLWESIKARCYNPKRKDYNNYGGRGITICKEWFCFDAFKNWALENGYKEKLSIDRINNDGNYEPNNCRLANRNTQSTNQRMKKNNKTGFTGISWDKNKNKFRARISQNYKFIHLGYFINIKDAVFARNTYILENKLEHKISIIEEN